MNDAISYPTPLPRPPGRPSWGMTGLDQRRIARWIGDAFAILCVRVSGNSAAEKHLRLGFEAILRQLGSSPLGTLTRYPIPCYAPPSVRVSDLRQIIRALDGCLAVFDRYGTFLSSTDRRIEALIRTTRRFAEEELQSRKIPPAEQPAVPLPSTEEVPC